MTPDFLSGEDDHTHDDAVASVSFISDAPLDMERFNRWISAILMEKGPDLLRTKGILHFGGKDQRFAFQAVHMLADGEFIGPWKQGSPRQSRIVFIGR
ncbi:MAG TPA: GTP-binding protein, partial [Roseiarcus sp.]|nr:GTP-binding protein [Roseiarcus sp.]